jgi:hypothetical protein
LRKPLLWTIALICGAALVTAAELGDAAAQAYTAHAARSREQFLRQVRTLPSAADRGTLRTGQVLVRPGTGDGIVDVPGGLFHNWHASIFIPGVTLDEVVSVSRAYSDYPKVFHPVMSASVLSDDGESLRVQLRMKESAGGLSAILDVRSNVQYVRADAEHVHVISSSDEIREVKDVGKPTERRLPAGQDSGYLWRAGTLTSFIAADGGVYMEMETTALSRPYPPLLGWVIEPIARRVGRRSVEGSVEEFRQAVEMRHPPSPGFGVASAAH